MPACSACKGRGVKKPTGLGLPRECDKCDGTGEKALPKAKSNVSISYGSRPDRCIYEGRIEGRDCYGAKTWDHIVKKRDIIAAILGGKGVNPENAKPLSEALSDRRNLVPACWGCNMLRESGNPAVQPQPADLPDGFREFVAQYELENDLPRHLKAAA